MAKKTKKKTKKTTDLCGTANDGAVEHVSVAPSSVEFSRDAKGNPRWTIKLYGESDDMDAVVDEVLRLDSRIREEVARG